MRRYLVLAVVALTAPGPPAARAQSRFELTIPKIMRGSENTGREPSQVRWSPDGQWIYFQWLSPGTDWKEALKPYPVRAAARARPQRLTPAAGDSLAAALAPRGGA